MQSAVKGAEWGIVAIKAFGKLHSVFDPGGKVNSIFSANLVQTVFVYMRGKWRVSEGGAVCVRAKRGFPCGWKFALTNTSDYNSFKLRQLL